jgi:hypothetical protein
MTETNVLTDTLDLVEEEASGSRVFLGDILKSLNHRGFGPLMLIPSLLVILPTGAIPGVPALSGAILCLLAIQIMIGRHYPWIPRKLEKVSIRRKTMLKAIERIRPYTVIIDKLVHPRFHIFSHPLIHVFVAALCCALGALMVVVGFIPFFPMFIGIPVFLFALGASARDGFMTVAGFIFTLATFYLLFKAGSLYPG